METDKQKFHKNPNINPETGKFIKIGGQTYHRLNKKYGVPQIKSPKTGKSIAVGKIAYQKLLSEGYTEKELLNITQNDEPYQKLSEGYTEKELLYKPYQNDEPSYQHEDILYNILLNSDMKTIKNICLTKKDTPCQNTRFWIDKFNHDDILLVEPFPVSLIGWIRTYEKMKEIEAIMEEALDVVKQDGYYLIDLIYKNKQNMIDVLGADYSNGQNNRITILLSRKKLEYKIYVGYARYSFINDRKKLTNFIPDKIFTPSEKEFKDLLFNILYKMTIIDTHIQF